jgi:acyl-[acyl-carrier-protein]-phospholipid O-acyltransferase/long-chain-fatty-acid--[acyl-carrier-protein] ligase
MTMQDRDSATNPTTDLNVAPAIDDRSSEANRPLAANRSFVGMTIAQFFGSFNDNVYKQLVLLFCLDVSGKIAGDRYQSFATLMFSLPFILLSGFAGFLADKHSKSKIVVWCKIAEIAILALGTVVFMRLGSGSGGFQNAKFVMWTSFVVLALMGVHSAMFGPPKYGILPELVSNRLLGPANGVFLMTTFLAIIFGQATAGFLSQSLGDRRWLGGLCCVGFALVGAWAARRIRTTPAANPELIFKPFESLFMIETMRLVWADRPLRGALIVYSLFWFVGGVVQQTVNAVGKNQIGLNDFATSVQTASVGVGIGVGSYVAGMLSRGRVNFTLVKIGLFGVIAALSVLSIPGSQVPDAEAPQQFGTWIGSFLNGGAQIAMLGLLGLSAGLYAVPLQVFLQARAPVEQKGRVIGAMNLVNWFFIFASAPFYFAATQAVRMMNVAPSWTYLATMAVLLPVLFFYRPPTIESNDDEASAGRPDR